jgi:hypothetical protein
MSMSINHNISIQAADTGACKNFISSLFQFIPPGVGAKRKHLSTDPFEKNMRSGATPLCFTYFCNSKLIHEKYPLHPKTY